MMDIDRLQRQVTDNNNEIGRTRAFVLSQGSRQSANEHLIPEQLFSTPQQSIQSVSAAKALQLAAQQGQKIFIITQENLSGVMSQLAHKAAIGVDIVDAVNAGKVVTVSQNDINYARWTGAGYIITDAVTGASAYMIGGGADGAFSSGDGLNDLSSGMLDMSLQSFDSNNPVYRQSLAASVGSILKPILGAIGAIGVLSSIYDIWTDDGASIGQKIAHTMVLIVKEILMRNILLAFAGGGSLLGFLIFFLMIFSVIGVALIASDLIGMVPNFIMNRIRRYA